MPHEAALRVDGEAACAARMNEGDAPAARILADARLAACRDRTFADQAWKVGRFQAKPAGDCTRIDDEAVPVAL